MKSFVFDGILNFAYQIWIPCYFNNYNLIYKLWVSVYFWRVRECLDLRLLSRFSALANTFKNIFLSTKFDVREVTCKWCHSISLHKCLHVINLECAALCGYYCAGAYLYAIMCFVAAVQCSSYYFMRCCVFSGTPCTTNSITFRLLCVVKRNINFIV